MFQLFCWEEPSSKYVFRINIQLKSPSTIGVASTKPCFEPVPNLIFQQMLCFLNLFCFKTKTKTRKHVKFLFSCQCSKVSICNYVTCHILHVTCHIAHVICQMLMLILGTCWTTFVLMSMLKSEYLWLCHISHFACHMSHCACHMSYIKCLCWFLGHAEQLLFWSLCSKVSIYNYVTCHMSHVACHMSYVKCLCWSLGHAEQLLFSCLCSKVTYKFYVKCGVSNVKCLCWSLGHA